MSKLKRVINLKDVILDDPFLADDTPSLRGQLIPGTNIEEFDHLFYKTALDKILVKKLKKEKRYDTGIDTNLAIDFHKALDIDRSIGADRNFWAWFTINEYPNFVAYRWKKTVPENNPMKRPPARYYKDMIRGSFSRLWWAVELTKDGTDYSLSKKYLKLPAFQDLHENIYGRSFCGYRPAVEAFLDKYGNSTESVYRAAAKRLGVKCYTRPIECMSMKEIKSFI